MTMENQDEILDSGNLVKNNVVEEQKIISLNKFIFLSIISFGAYEIWWIYKAWRFYKQKEKLDIMPAARALFSIFFLNSLFNKILEFAKEKGYNDNYSPTILFSGFLIGIISGWLPDPFWLISILSFIFFIPPFKALNFAKQNSTDFIVSEQLSFSGRQIALIVIGVIFWALVLMGMVLMGMIMEEV
jgi:hypothetical protein